MAIKTSNQITFTEQKKIIEIKEWYLATSKSENVTRDTQGWTTEIQTINIDKKYLWNYEEVIYSIGSSDLSDPIIIGFYGKGDDGRSISNIKNYYLVTQTPELPQNPKWLEKVPILSPTDKYLWNYEVITYTDDTTTKTDAAIIGAYGDSGTDAVDFQIYSVDGFEFSDELTSIELKTIAFQAGEKIDESKMKYQWKWWNDETGKNGKYEEIIGATSSTLKVKKNDEYAFSSIKCEMRYDGLTYEDYVSLTDKTISYAAVVSFFNGSNIIAVEKDYLIMYIELYKNNAPEEVLYSKNVYKSDNNKVNGNTITTDISDKYFEGDMVYFVCKEIYDGIIEYNIILGEYTSNHWEVAKKNNYIYTNDLFTHTISPVIFVPKGKISKALNINCNVQKDDGSETIVARTSAVVMDLNDPIVSNSEPSSPQKGQLWLDTSVPPSILKMWDGNGWVNSGYQNGNVVYTSQPNNGYSKGDLWILADGEKCGNYGPGSMLKANVTSNTFNASHWEDAMEENTAILNNVKQYFLFNDDTGLRIGQADEKFYVNISSTEMGFYDASSGTAQKVVSISNQSATIKNLTVEDGATFNCEVKFGDFIWKMENNGSLSLALAT